jgi:hypothetical protein
MKERNDMAWTTPKTDWTTGELVSAEDMNAVGENLAQLGNLRSAVSCFATTENTSIPAGTTFADVDSDNLSLTITTSGGDVLVHFHGSLSQGHFHYRFDVKVDGNLQGHEMEGIAKGIAVNYEGPAVSFTRLIRNLVAGSHTFKLQARFSHQKTLYAGAQFWVREI